MSTVVHLPPELRDFMELPGPQTLLLRGPPGSGKTTLSMTLLSAFHGDKFLVTSRVPGSELSREFPWLGENGRSAIHIIDTSEMEESVHDVAQIMAGARDTLLKPGSDEEREALSFLWLPPPLQEIWARLSEGHRALIVLDSWDALVEQYLGSIGVGGGPMPDPSQIERLLLRRMSHTPAHLVFVLERSEETALDYLVNGVVVAQRDATEERLQRWLTVLKLRGVRIANPVYPYTLEQGRFETILPARAYTSLRPGRPDPPPDMMRDHIWPGSKAYAENFGRMTYSRITTIEMDDSTPIQVGELLAFPAIAYALSCGGPALIVPHSSETPHDVFQQLRTMVPMERILQRLRILVPKVAAFSDQEDVTRTLLPIERLEFLAPGGDTMRSSPGRHIQEASSPSTPGVVMISAQGLEMVASLLGTPITTEGARQLPAGLQGIVRGIAAHAIVMVRRSSPFKAPIQAVASTRLEVNMRQSRIFIHGVSPWTSNYVLAEGSEESAFELVRVV